MISLDKAEARAMIRVADAQTIAQLVASDRSVLLRDDVEDQIEQGPLILDGLRRRPRYFDGRFLTGADLTRDQDYVRQRQADMARAGGAGVITGLRVANRTLTQGQTLSISPGVGLTPSGDVVMLSTKRDVPLLDLPTSRQLDATLGLSEEPRVPLGRRTGLFILALRPVEFTANPIAAYPRSITGHRTVEDGDIIEASAITLIPYPDLSGAANIAEARRKVARAIFNGRGAAMPQDALPLAMLGIDRGTVRWIDTAMVRRETGAESGVHAVFGTRPRAVAEAFVLQHRTHLSDILTDMTGRGLPPVFPAASVFSLLPPVGAMPAAAIRPDGFGFNQLYFPPGVDVDVAFVPQDELASLAEEALALPPIDLDAPATDLDATGITVLVPVDRPRYQRFSATLGGANLTVAGNAATATVAGSAFDLVSSLVARRKALEATTRDAAATAAAEAEAMRIKAWQTAFAEAVSVLPRGPSGVPLVWYSRRRSIAQQTRVTGTGVAVSGDDIGLNASVNANLDRLKLAKRLAAINGQATPQAAVRLLTLLGSPRVADSDVLTASVVSDMEKIVKDELPEVIPTPPIVPPIVAQPDATPNPAPAPTPKPAPGETPPIIFRPPILSATLLRAAINPAVLSARVAKTEAVSDAPPAETLTTAPEIATLRPGLTRLAVANAVGLSTASREDTPLKLGEGEVMDVAQDYAGARLGEGLHRAQTAIGGDWPSVKEALWLGESGKSLAVDMAFRTVGEETLADFADLLKDAVSGQKPKLIDDLLAKMA